MSQYSLEDYFKKFEKDILNLSDSSINHYKDAIKKISKILVEKDLLQESIYEISDINKLIELKETLSKFPDFEDLDKNGHRMYSCGLKAYIKFASGVDFNKVGNIVLLDTEQPVPAIIQKETKTISRSTIIKNQIIIAANYKCEINPKHTTFISKVTEQQYMEGHHIIPIKHQNCFSNSLDIYANVICLCPICHRLLHFGKDNQRKDLLSNIYSVRQNRLYKGGIEITKSDLIELALT